MDISKQRRSLVAAMTLAAFLAIAVAPSVMAECTWPPPPASQTFDARFAFTATAREVSKDVPRAASGQPPYEWHVELTIDQTYRGKVPARIILNGRNYDCHTLLGQELRQGDRLFVAFDRRGLDYGGFYGPMLLWRRTDVGWSFYPEALTYGSDARFYPAVARNATTTAQILDVISATPPDTSTSAGPAQEAPEQPVVLVALAFALAFAIALKRTSPHHPNQ